MARFMHGKIYWTLAVILCLTSCLWTSPAIAQEAPLPDGTIAASAEQYAIFLPFTSQPMRTATPFGVQMYFDTSSSAPSFGPLMELNASWVRSQVLWSYVEPSNTTPDQFIWDMPDGGLAVAREGGMNVIATITRNPDWASPNLHGYIPTENLDDFAEFMGAVVERYDGDGYQDDPQGSIVKYWELYNEPDGASKPDEIRWGEYGEEYANMLKAVYPVIKAADPEAQVVFGGIAYDWFTDQGGSFTRSFLSDVLANGGGAYFDVMNFHVYPAFAPNWVSQPGDGPGLYEKAEAIRQVMAPYGVSKPMMITEAGSHSNADGTSSSTPEIQASYVVALYTQTMAADILTMIWFMLYDPPEWYPNKTGLMDNSNPPVLKPAYYTYQRTAAKLSRATFDRILSDEEIGNDSMLAYRFTDGAGRPLYVAWMAPLKESSSATLVLSGGSAQVLDIFGVSTEVQGDNGRLEIPVTNQPVIIEVRE